MQSTRFPVRVLLATLSVVFVVATTKSAQAYTPDDPVVQGMVDKGITYLESLGPDKLKSWDGEMLLVGYAHHKCRHDPEHPVVQRAIKWAINYCDEVSHATGHLPHKGIYEIAVCVLFLADVDPVAYRPQLQTLQNVLMESQFPHGGFGYPGETDGDVSQTQYAILAIWTLDRNGIPLDYNRVVACVEWLMRVQDVTGTWPYHGKDPGPGRPNTSQPKTSFSMGLAGGSSVLIGGDALRLWGDTAADDADPGIPGLPKAIKLYVEDANVSRRKNVKLSEAPIKRSIGFLSGWVNKNPYKVTPGMNWHYYILYTMERYESFLEIANGAEKDPSPAWYNQMVDVLRSTQSAEGGWTDRSHTSPPISTAFSLLFLIRSTQKTIFTTSAGTLEGGYGLPKDTTNIRVDGTQIKGQAVATQVTDLLKILEDDGAGETEGKSLPENLELDPTPDGRRVQLDRLERLVRGSKSYQARRVAAKLLGKSDELRVVPALIFALSDPDTSVRRYARDGLRFISRKFEGFGMPDKPSKGELDQAQRQWRDWYRKTDPTYVFLDYDL